MFLSAGGDTQIGGLEVISELKSPITGIGLEKIETNPGFCQTLFALIKLRSLRIIRDLQKLYFMILLPLGLAALGLYLNSIHSMEPKIKSLELNGTTYGQETLFALHNETSENLDRFINEMIDCGVVEVDVYDGNYSKLLEIGPHMAALNINVYDISHFSITIVYNDTAQHSLPIILNIINNVLYR